MFWFRPEARSDALTATASWLLPHLIRALPEDPAAVPETGFKPRPGLDGPAPKRVLRGQMDDRAAALTRF